jgi:hypothetical protein
MRRLNMLKKSNLKKSTMLLVLFSFTLILGWFGCGGGGSSSSPGPSPNPVPDITTLSPSSVTAGAPAQTLTINGTGFLSSSTVTYNSVAHTATYVSASQLTIQLSASDQAAGGNYPVVVTNPSPGGGASNSVNFTVNNPTPAISLLSPAVAPAGTSSQNVAIGGSNFLSSSTLTFNGSSHAVTYVSSTQLTLSLSTSDLVSAGTDSVVVTNPPPGGGPSNATTFTVFQPVTAEQATTNAQGQAAFSDAAITIQVDDLVTQQPLPGMSVVLLRQENSAPAITVMDPAGKYVPIIQTLNDPAGTAASPSIGDPAYTVNTFPSIMGPVVMWSTPAAILAAVNYQQTCDSVLGSGVLQAVEKFVTPSALGTVILDVSGISLGAIDIVGDAVEIPQAANQETALLYASYIASYSPNGTYLVCSYSGGNPLLGFDLISIQSTGTSTSNFPATVQGTVQDSLGSPLSGVSVTAQGPNQQTVQTNASGDFTISDLATGSYLLQALEPGYVPSTNTVVLSPGTNSTQLTLPSTAVATSVQFSSGPPYTITITGKGFGSPQQPMPYSGDLGNFRIGDPSCSATTPGWCEEGYTGDAFTLNYQSWSDSQIVVGGYSQEAGSNVASPGDAVGIGIWNNSSQTASAGFVWAGNLPPVPSNTPRISAVLFSGTGANLQITILGSGFGSTPPAGVASSRSGTPYLGLTSNLQIGDYAGRFPQPTASVPFQAGYSNPVDGAQDPVTVNYLSWSDSEIDLGGFGGEYGSSSFIIQSGDPISITVWSTTNSLATAWGGYVP